MPLPSKGNVRDELIIRVANATIAQYRANGCNELDVAEILSYALFNHMDALTVMRGTDPAPMFKAMRDAIEKRIQRLAALRPSLLRPAGLA